MSKSNTDHSLGYIIDSQIYLTAISVSLLTIITFFSEFTESLSLTPDHVVVFGIFSISAYVSTFVIKFIDEEGYTVFNPLVDQVEDGNGYFGYLIAPIIIFQTVVATANMLTLSRGLALIEMPDPLVIVVLATVALFISNIPIATSKRPSLKW